MNDNDPLGPTGSELHAFLVSRDLTLGNLIERLTSGISNVLRWSKPTALLAFSIICTSLLAQHWEGFRPQGVSWLALGVALLLVLAIDRIETIVGRWVYQRKLGWAFNAVTA